MRAGEHVFEVAQGGLPVMVPIDEGEFHVADAFEDAWQGVAEGPFHGLHVPYPQFLQPFPGDRQGVRTTFQREHHAGLRSTRQIGRGDAERGAELQDRSGPEMPHQPVQQPRLPWRLQGRTRDRSNAPFRSQAQGRTRTQVGHVDAFPGGLQTPPALLDVLHLRQGSVPAEHLVHERVDEGRMHTMTGPGLHQMPEVGADTVPGACHAGAKYTAPRADVRHPGGPGPA